MTIIDMLQDNLFFHNTAWDYLVAVGVFLGVFLGFKMLETIVLVRLEKLTTKTKTDIDDVVIHAIKTIGTLFYIVIGVYLAVDSLVLSGWLDKAIDVLFLVMVSFELIQAMQIIIQYSLSKYSSKQEPDHEPNTAFVHLGMLFARIVLWAVGLLFVLSNLGIDITALAASLGIGSLAIALALQSVLSDIFSSFSIYADKPFEVGDFISIGTDSGTVKRIGLKTTRLATLQGEELVMANKELTTARVQNFKKMNHRRVSITFGVEYSTTQAQLRAIPDMVKRIVEEIEHLSFSRCHFSEFGDSALLFECIYHVDTREYSVYMDTRQSVNLDLFKKFEKEQIAFAFPTQTIIVEKAS